MGYETDSYQVMAAGTVCAAGAITIGAGTTSFAGSDFVRGVLRVNVTAQAGTQSAWGVVLQSSDGTSWYPSYATVAVPAASAPGYPGSGYIPLGTTAATGLYHVPFLFFPGATFRVGLLVTGGTSITCGISGDFQKYVADNS